MTDSITPLNKSRFSKMVEKGVLKNGHSYMDAIVDLCGTMGIDLEDVNKFISPIVKGKLEAEASKMNLLQTNNPPLKF